MLRLLAIIVAFSCSTAFAQRDRCLVGIPETSVESVSAAWRAALRGEPKAHRKLVFNGTHPCTDVYRFERIQYPEVGGCDAAGRHAAVFAGQCRAKRGGTDPVTCGTAILDLEAERFVQFVPGAADGINEQHFLGSLFIVRTQGGFRARWGEGLAKGRAFGGRPLEMVDAARTLVLTTEGDWSEQVQRWRIGSKAPVPVAAPFLQVHSAVSVDGGRAVWVQGEARRGRRNLVFNSRTGAVIFDVEGVRAQAIAPDGTRMFVSYDHQHELHKAGARPQAVPTLATGAVAVRVNWSRNRALVLQGGAVEVFELEPLRRVSRLEPFGDQPFTPLGVRLSASARAVVVSWLVQHEKARGLRTLFIPLDGGEPSELGEGWYSAPREDEVEGLWVIRGVRPGVPPQWARVGDDGTIQEAPPPPYADSDAGCSQRAGAIVQRVARGGVHGIILPAAAVVDESAPDGGARP